MRVTKKRTLAMLKRRNSKQKHKRYNRNALKVRRRVLTKGELQMTLTILNRRNNTQKRKRYNRTRRGVTGKVKLKESHKEKNIDDF